MKATHILAAAALACAACAAPPQPEPAPPAEASLLPGSIGVAVGAAERGLVVTALSEDAARAGVRKGDLVVRYNGAAVASPRDFNRLVVDSRPRSTARLEVLRDGAVHVLQLPVHQADTMPRA